jgi:hypothetical protein
MPIFLGNQQIGLASLGSLYVANIQQVPAPPPAVPIPTNGLQMWLDPTTYTTSGSVWLSSYGNGTGSFTGSYTYSGSNFFNYPQATKLNFSTTSGSLDYSTTQNTIFVVGRASGSGAPGTVGRILNGKSNNWLMGTYSAGGTNYMRAYDPGGAGGFFDTSFDNAWRVHTGIWQNTASASYYVNGAFVTTLTNTGRVGPNGICINDIGGENGQGDLGDVILYNRVLSDSEITQVYNAIKSKYGL